MKFIIFTDLDGTLLDSCYSFEKALPAMKLVEEKKLPLILCSSKTRNEIEFCRIKLNNNDPFISENGGGIFIPDSLKLNIKPDIITIEKIKGYSVIKLGASYSDLRGTVNELRSEGFDLTGFGDMSVDRVSELTGLKISDAKMAKIRDFDEPFIHNCGEKELEHLKRRIKERGFNYTEGVFSHIMGDSNKGRAVDILKRIYEDNFGAVKTIALGDSPNDIEMLQKADYPVVVKKENGRYHPKVIGNLKSCIKAEGIGPEGWNSAVLKLFETLVL